MCSPNNIDARHTFAHKPQVLVSEANPFGPRKVVQQQQSRLMLTPVLPCRLAQAMQRPLCASMTAGQGRMHTSAPPQSEC